MFLLLLGMAGAMAVQDSSAPPVAPRHWPMGVGWERPPQPAFPAGETGTLQVSVSCVVAYGQQLRDCRVTRWLPERTRFSLSVIRDLPNVRIRSGRASPGDTIAFDVWACPSPASETPCVRAPWPDGPEATADAPPSVSE